MTPIQILTKELNSYEKALNKSRLSVYNQKIDYATHKMHKDNLIPLITQYKQAIKKLNA
jgi:hypothetical protein